jgi:hypothetical protein
MQAETQWPVGRERAREPGISEASPVEHVGLMVAGVDGYHLWGNSKVTSHGSLTSSRVLKLRGGAIGRGGTSDHEPAAFQIRCFREASTPLIAKRLARHSPNRRPHGYPVMGRAERNHRWVFRGVPETGTVTAYGAVRARNRYLIAEYEPHMGPGRPIGGYQMRF